MRKFERGPADPTTTTRTPAPSCSPPLTPGPRDWRPPVASLGQMARPARSLPATTRFIEVERLFLDDSTLSSIVVCGPHGEPIGVTRERFFMQLAGNLGFGRALYSRRSVEEASLPPTLVLPAGMSVAAAAGTLLQRPREGRYDDLVVRFDDGSLATVRAADLLTALSNAHAFDAHHDGLTGLPNRKLFLSYLDAAQTDVTGGGGVAVLFVDLDDFKAINDGLGHHAGDTVLSAVAARLRGAVRSEDTVARLSGDEFVVLVRGVRWLADATAYAERLQATLVAPVRVADHAVRVRASVGVALETAGEHGEPLLRNADLAMYAAKGRGKGRYELYEPTMRTDTLTRLELRSGLEDALEREELALVYQPIVDLSREETVAVEALLRWRHRERGLLGPAEFIPLAEETGLIVPIGRWVLREACRQAQRWARRRAGRVPLGVAVNISPRQLEDPALVDHVTEALADSGLIPSALTLEITEGVFVGQGDILLERLHALKRLGVSLALDDFGAGFSSLGYLARMPLDVLKLDRAFTARLGGEERDGLMAGIVEIARSLRMDTVAEGVERADQVPDLKAMGCAYAQGYLFARPLDVDAVTLLVEEDANLTDTAWPAGRQRTGRATGPARAAIASGGRSPAASRAAPRANRTPSTGRLRAGRSPSDGAARRDDQQREEETQWRPRRRRPRTSTSGSRS